MRRLVEHVHHVIEWLADRAQGYVAVRHVPSQLGSPAPRPYLGIPAVGQSALRPIAWVLVPSPGRSRDTRVRKGHQHRDTGSSRACEV